jgi:predicted XRE-type DNA-binding protein
MDMINGSNGLGGAADQIMVLVRKRNCPDAKLFSMGRAVKDLYLGLTWEDVECSDGWSIAGDMEVIETKLEKKKIISIMAENGGPMSQTQIAKLAGCSQANVSEIMKILIEKDIVEKAGYAKYQYIG